MVRGQSRFIAVGLCVAGLTGIHSDFLLDYIAKDMQMPWMLARCAPICLAFIYLTVIKHVQSPLVRIFFLIPAIITTLSVERLSLPPQTEWLIGLPLSYQEFDVLLWAGLTAVLTAHHLRAHPETNQPLDYARRSLLVLSGICIIGLWLLPAMGDTLQARSGRWMSAFQSGSLALEFPHQSLLTFWLETAGLVLPMVLLLLQTATIRLSKPRHRWACIGATIAILLWCGQRYPEHDSFTLVWLSLRSSLLIILTAILMSRVTANALLFWNLPVPNRPQGSPPSIRAERLNARMAYQENDKSRPAYRKSIKRLVDRCHRALELEAKSKNHPIGPWIAYRLSAESDPSQPCPEQGTPLQGKASEFHHYLSRGRRLEIIMLTWLLLLGLGWSEWRTHAPFLDSPIEQETPFDTTRLWRDALSSSLLNQSVGQSAPEILASRIAPNLKQDIIWKLKSMEALHGISDINSIFDTISKCQIRRIDEQREPECDSAHLIEPLVLTGLETLETARQSHQKNLTRTFRAPQLIRDLTARHPDRGALELSRHIAGQLAALQERFMARAGLFGLIVAAHEKPQSPIGEAATITLNLLAPPDVLYQRLHEDTRLLAARAQSLYTTIFGSPMALQAIDSSGKKSLGLLE